MPVRTVAARDLLSNATIRVGNVTQKSGLKS